MFRGSMVALVTPMSQGRVDIPRLKNLVDFHINQGTHALVAAGTTGESGTLSHDEKLLVIKTVIDHAQERIPVIAGTFMNATHECAKLTQKAMELGAHAALIMTPAYIRPTQQGLYEHYEFIAQEVPIPIILYNVPTRTACDLLPETVGRLSHLSNIIGIKEATPDLERLRQLLALTQGRMDIYSGDDLNAAEWMLEGAQGVISVTANAVPKLMAKLCDLALDKNTQACMSLQEQLKPLHQHLFIESNPIPIKWVMHELGLIDKEIRLPLKPLSEEHQAPLIKILTHLELLP